MARITKLMMGNNHVGISFIVDGIKHSALVIEHPSTKNRKRLYVAHSVEHWQEIAVQLTALFLKNPSTNYDDVILTMNLLMGAA